jgi:hypothetical protein
VIGRKFGHIPSHQFLFGERESEGKFEKIGKTIMRETETETETLIGGGATAELSEQWRWGWA